ncbi:hypothetical protein D3C87_1372550 [compost metagenome]
MKKIFFALATLVMTSCATVSNQVIPGPDNTPHQLINCYDIRLCYAKAAEVCKDHYKIVNTTTKTSSNETNSESTTSLLVKCEEVQK